MKRLIFIPVSEFINIVVISEVFFDVSVSHVWAYWYNFNIFNVRVTINTFIMPWYLDIEGFEGCILLTRHHKTHHRILQYHCIMHVNIIFFAPCVCFKWHIILMNYNSKYIYIYWWYGYVVTISVNSNIKIPFHIPCKVN